MSSRCRRAEQCLREVKGSRQRRRGCDEGWARSLRAAQSRPRAPYPVSPKTKDRVVSTDLCGIARPQGAGYDLGAYEGATLRGSEGESDVASPS